MQLSIRNCKFRQLPPNINKISITSLKLHNVNQFIPPSNSSVSQHDVLQISLKFYTYVQNTPKLKNLYIFFLLLKNLYISFQGVIEVSLNIRG